MTGIRSNTHNAHYAGKTQRRIVSAWVGTAVALAVSEPWPKAP
jgi:hypothetical protein